MKHLLTFLIASVLVCLSFTTQNLNQSASPSSASDIIQKLQKLNTVGSVLYVAAHPDDENTRLLPYLTNERHLRTGYLSLTRGDGGQNLIGKEQGDALGLIRTQELLAARRIDGAEQFFTRANDFGFSKNPEETFAIWNKDSILADVVWTIRRFKPDVIICRFPTTGEGGHGHHTASAILTVEAFSAAADPTRFPEQLKYTEVWQAKRLFWNTFNFGTTNTTSPTQVKIDIGGYNALLGKSYGELAGENRSMHKSQGFGTAPTRGENIEYFKQLKGDSVSKDIFEGINTTWSRFPATAKLTKSIDAITKSFNPTAPQNSLQALVTLYHQLKAVDDKDASVRYWKNQKLKEIEQLLLDCSGLFMEATASTYMGTPGSEVSLTTQIINRNPSSVTLNKINFFSQTDTTTTLALKTNQLYTFKHKEKMPVGISSSNPYWLNEKHSIGLFTVRDPLLIGKPENDPALTVRFDLTIAGLPLTVVRPVVYKSTDPVKGEVYRPYEVLPKVTVNMMERVYVFNDTLVKKIKLLVKANVDSAGGVLQVVAPPGWRVDVPNSNYFLKSKNDELIVDAYVWPLPGCTNGKIVARMNLKHDTLKSIQRMEYDHIPYQFILSDAEANLVYVDVKKSGNRIGYIPGAGDDVVPCLKQIGYDVTILTDEMLDHADLSVYDAIITGIRAYNTNDRLQVYYTKLMTYVQNGGNLIVQYNTNNRIGPLLAKIGPYPFTISRDRVTDEKAEVRILDPNHPVFNYPNKITANDFEGWVQERGIYFATEVDKQYTSLLSMNDPNEKALEGSLIVTKYGKGNFVYTGLAFFRELPAGVPGSYRLFVNLLSLQKNK